jgi:peptidoglycan hydrolase-like protein with peptidoglycan-binding domain
MRLRTVICVAALAAFAPLPAEAGIQTAGLQVALRAHGVYSGQIDAIRGPVTRDAVIAFQRRAGLVADGAAGPQTRAALGPLGRHLFGTRTIVKGAVGWDVSVLQFLLLRGRYLSCAVDGTFGPATEAAVRNFQRAHGLSEDGIAGPRTLKVLASGAAPVQPAVVTRHVVRPGETLTAIAQRYRTSVLLLARVTGLDPTRDLFIGARLRVPVSSGPSAVNDPFDVRVSLARWAAYYGIDASLVRALAWQESGFNNDLVSSAGAMGVMQLLPETWDYAEDVLVGATIPRTVDGNVHAGTAYLNRLLAEFSGDQRLALGAWYQGAAAVRKYGLYEETKTFVANVLALASRM